jgi:TsgA-like MFS transporter
MSVVSSGPASPSPVREPGTSDPAHHQQRVLPTAVAIASYVIVSGVFTQSGAVLGPAASFFHTSAPDAASLFTAAGFGNLGGILVSIFAFTAFSIQRVLVAAYVVALAGAGIVATAPSLGVAIAGIFVLCLGVGTGLSAGAVILAKLYTDRARAIAFLSTDCAFSATGFVIPVVVGLVIASGKPWYSGYLIVAALAAVVLLACLRITFPARDAAPPGVDAERTARPVGAMVTIALFALGLATYLTGQTTFTVWAPTVLHEIFGVETVRANAVVSQFFGPSSLGLITAAVVVTRVPPRFVLIFALLMGAAATTAIALTHNPAFFFLATTVFGFTTTCMFKLMISIGSEQLPTSPPALVSFLLFCSGLGTTAAPLVSAQVVRIAGTHASMWFACGCYVATLIVMLVALAVERGTNRYGTPVRPTPT